MSAGPETRALAAAVLHRAIDDLICTGSQSALFDGRGKVGIEAHRREAWLFLCQRNGVWSRQRALWCACLDICPHSLSRRFRELCPAWDKPQITRADLQRMKDEFLPRSRFREIDMEAISA